MLKSNIMYNEPREVEVEEPDVMPSPTITPFEPDTRPEPNQNPFSPSIFPETTPKG